MLNKMTLTDRINAMTFDSLSEADFDFLVERALKSVRPAAKGPRKPTKAQLANAELADKMAAYVAEHGAVTCAELEDAFGLSNQKVSAILNRSGKFVKASEAKGKVKATYTVAQCKNKETASPYKIKTVEFISQTKKAIGCNDYWGHKARNLQCVAIKQVIGELYLKN